MKEQIRLRWNPLESITPFIALNELKQSSNELQLTFTLLDRHKDHFFKESGIATFTFINPFAVRYSSEGDRLDLINAKHVDKESNDSILEFPIWPLFKVENSSLLQWQKEIDAVVEYDEKRLTCYEFTEIFYLIEILSETEPEIKIVKD